MNLNINSINRFTTMNTTSYYMVIKYTSNLNFNQITKKSVKNCKSFMLN